MHIRKSLAVTLVIDMIPREATSSLSGMCYVERYIEWRMFRLIFIAQYVQSYRDTVFPVLVIKLSNVVGNTLVNPPHIVVVPSKSGRALVRANMTTYNICIENIPIDRPDVSASCVTFRGFFEVFHGIHDSTTASMQKDQTYILATATKNFKKRGLMPYICGSLLLIPLCLVIHSHSSRVNTFLERII